MSQIARLIDLLPEQWQPIARRFLVFVGVGAVGTLAHYLVLISLIELAGVWAPAAATLGFICGAVVNYVLNYRITFKSQQDHRTTLPRFFTIAATGGLLNWLIVLIAVESLRIHYLLGQAFATGVVVFASYAANSAWTFGSDQSSRK
jgi:putative flippase GtrA